MPTFPSPTRTISIAAPPATVLGLIGDPERLPEWAPDFVASELPFTLRSSAEAGTVDIVVSETPAAGVFARVLPNGEGSELVFTLILPVDLDAERLASQTATIETELSTIRSLCEA